MHLPTRVLLRRTVSHDCNGGGGSVVQVVIAVLVHRGRPEIPKFEDVEAGSGEAAGLARYVALLESCWADQADARPSFASIISVLQSIEKDLQGLA
jgi:hypothetical protein